MKRSGKKGKWFKPLPLEALEQICETPGCGHQNAGHTGGADAWGWPIWDETWMNALGSCTVPGCECTRRTGQRYVA